MKFPTFSRNPLYPALLALVMLLAASPGWATVRALLDRDTVYEGDSVTLTLEAEGGQGNTSPDLAPLEKDFEVLGTSTSTQMSIINGRVSNKTRWHVQLQPRHRGRLHIPAIRLAGEQTPPLALTVTEVPEQATSQAGQPVFVQAEVEAADKPVYVQQQIPYTVRLYYDARLQEGELTAPEPGNAVVEQLGEDRRYRTTIDGRPYQVIERHYVISPEKSGALHIPPATFRGRIAADTPRSRRRPRSMMEQFLQNSPFANDPFFRDNLLDDDFFASPFGNPGKPVAARSPAIDIEVKPRPAAATNNWLPAQAVTLTDSWTEHPPEFRVGEPVSRTITIQTRGLAGSQIPELTIEAPDNVRLYPETPSHESRTDGKTIYGVRRQTVTYIANRQGTLDIPAIRLDWWNTRSNRADRTTLPAWQFPVQPGTAGRGAPPPAVGPQPQAQATDKAVPPAEENRLATWKQNLLRHWPWWSLAAGLLLTLSGFMLWRRSSRRHADAMPAKSDKPTAARQPGKSHRSDEKSALQALKKACEDNDRHAAARALLKLGHAHWPEDPPRSLGALAARLEQGQPQLQALDRSLYAGNETAWNGAELWAMFRHGLPVGKARRQNTDNDLEPLYPQHT